MGWLVVYWVFDKLMELRDDVEERDDEDQIEEEEVLFDGE